MALTDKDILITPNIGSANEPKIEFKGASASVGPSTITATIYPTNNGTLSFDGTAGQLFSITNNLTSGSIFSVNDVSGIPSINVDANGTINFGSYGGNIGLGVTNPTQKLHVQGNVRITGTLYDSNNLAGTSGQVLKSTGVGITWVSGSGSGIDADTLDGLNSTQFVRSDADTTLSAVYTFSSTATSPKLAMSGHAGAASYNYFLNASNDTGVKVVHFLNGSTRTADGGVNTYTIRNDGGSLRLGNASYSTLLEGSALTFNSNTVWHAGNTVPVANGGTGATTRKTASGSIANFGQLETHGTYSDANAVQQWGGTYIQGSTNTPNFNGSTQHYQMMLSLGSNYDWGSGNAYAMQMCIARNVSTPYIGIRYKEGGADTANWGSWNKIAAGYADDANLLDGLNSTQFLRSDVSATNSVDLRAPIFYDSNDTNYYVNPNSFSQIGWLRLSADWNSSGVHAEQLTVRGTYASLCLRATNGNQPYWLIHNDATAGLYFYGGRTGGANGDSWGWGARVFGVDDGRYLEGALSLRSPIFYDSNNTGYYADFADTGNAINIAGSLRAATYNKPAIMTVASGNASTGASIVIQQETTEGWTAIFADFEPNTGWGFYHDNPSNYFSFTSEISTGSIRSFTVPSRSSGNRTAYEKFRIDQNNGDFITGRDGYAQSSFRAPIFYDSDDTNYYVNPATGTNLSGTLINNGGTAMTSGWNRNLLLQSTYPVIVFNSNNTKYSGIGVDFSSPVSGFLFWVNGSSTDISGTGTVAMSINTGNYVTASGSFRAPIFYDSDDTNYYVNPAGTSQLNIGRFSGGAYTNTYSFTVAGTKGNGNYAWVRTSLGGFNAGGDTVRFTVTRSIYDNGSDPYGGCTADFTVHSREWHSGQESCTVFYSQHGSAPYGQYITNAGPRDLAGGGYWFYMRVLQGVTYRVYVHSESGSMGSFNGTSETDPGSLPPVSTGFNVLGTNGNSADVVAQNNSYGLASVRSPIFYDNNDTGYYCDPNSTSNLWYTQFNDRVSLVKNRGHFTGLDATTGAGGRGQLVLSSYYSDVVIASQENNSNHGSTISFTAVNPSNSGDYRKFVINQGNWGGSQYLRFGWRDGSFPNPHDYVEGATFGAYDVFGLDGSNKITYALGQMRSPIYYDNNDTAYYLDPNSTGQAALRVRGGTIHGPNPSWGAYLLVGGDGRQGYIDNTTIASVSTTNGNLHLDSASGCETYINYYDGSNVYFGNGASAIVAQIASNGTFRSPVFYDYNDTNYYVDPASNSFLSRLRVGPYAGSTSTGNQTGLEIINNGGTGDSDVAAISFHCSGTYGMHMHLRNDSYFGIGGWSASTWRWYVQMSTGDMTAAGNVNSNSDIRLKEEIKPINNALEKIQKINGVSFKWKNISDVVGNPGQRDYGVIAQEIEQVFPEVVHESAHESPDGDKYKTVSYDKLVPVLIQAIKEQQNQINAMKEELKNLKISD